MANVAVKMEMCHNKVKWIKRSSYGQTRFPFLQRRALLHPTHPPQKKAGKRATKATRKRTHQMNKANKILRIEQDIPWLPKPNESQLVLSSLLPPQNLITTAFAFAFLDNQILMTHLIARGWDIPGGHREPGEHPEETVHREIREETGATLHSLHLLGHQHLRLLGPKPFSYRYPYPDSYQLFYWTQIASLNDFLPTTETQGRALFSPPEARKLSWVQTNNDLYETALSLATNQPE
jgi:8-oxo-dGTP diphosphatase